MSIPVPPVERPSIRDVLGDGLGLLARYIREAPRTYALAACGSVVFVSSIVASSYVIGYVTDSVIIPVVGDGEPVGSRLRLAVLAIIGVSVVKSVGIITRRAAAGWLQFGAQTRVRKRLIDHQLGLSLRWYADQSVGDLLSISDQDARQATFVLAPLPFATGVSVLLVLSLIAITLTDIWLGLAAFLLLAVVVTVDVIGGWRLFGEMQHSQRLRGAVASVAHESFDGALTVKSLGREEHETDRFRGTVTELKRQLIRVGRIQGTFRAVTEIAPSVGIVVILYVGVVGIAAGRLTPGEVVRVAYLLTLLAVPIRLIGYLVWDLANSVAADRRVQSVLDVDDRLTYGQLPPSEVADGSPIDGVGVGFGYDPNVPVLHDLDLTVPAGRTLAVVGPTGSGKSTLLALLARLWDPVDGAIRLDGRDVRDLAPKAVAREVAYVAQEAFLFDADVRGNLDLGHGASDADLRSALEVAGAAAFVDELPNGLDTPLGERGATLSGGQKQRIALARALLARPRLLLLDDATSAVDPSVEARILGHLTRADLPSTVVVVAYRRASITLADEVVFVDGGRILDHGTHDELLGRCPGYASLLEAYDTDEEVPA